MNLEIDCNQNKKKCIVCCGQLNNEKELSLGSYAVCNKFPRKKDICNIKHDISMNQCDFCGLIQLTQFPAIDDVRPKHPWIKYNEPSGHLNIIAEYLSTILTANSSCLGIGPFDAPLLEKIANLGFKGSQLELQSDAHNEDGSFSYLESYESALELVLQNSSLNQSQDVILYRYLLEHARNPVTTLKNLAKMLKPNGHLVIEVPNSKKFISSHDYSFIWEEHISYFTEDTLNRCVEYAGLHVQKVFNSPGILEDGLTFILVLSSEKKQMKEQLTSPDSKELNLFNSYANNFEPTRHLYIEKIKKLKSEGKDIIFFGAGHQAIMFINLMGIKDYIECVVDDDLNKSGTYLTDSMIPVVKSKDFFGLKDFDICMMGVPPPTDIKIMKKLEDFLINGRSVYSIFSYGSSVPSLLSK